MVSLQFSLNNYLFFLFYIIIRKILVISLSIIYEWFFTKLLFELIGKNNIYKTRYSLHIKNIILHM